MRALRDHLRWCSTVCKSSIAFRCGSTNRSVGHRSDAVLLEQRAKNEPGKNAVALFDAHQAHTYPWPVFTARVMGEKYAMLSRFFAGQDERGMAFLYRMTELLRQAENDKLNLARYAYLLARLQPKRSSGSYALYNEFSKQMYAWDCSGTDRLQLVTAIYLYVYMNRKAD